MDGDKADHLYLIESGQLKLTKTTTDGKELTLQVFSDGELVGVPGLFEENLSYNTTASMLQAGEINIIPRQSLERLLLKNGLFCAEFCGGWVS
ncbi:cyclic nucleotide-binding domain-containing protein [Brevibacillus laterosporus]